MNFTTILLCLCFYSLFCHFVNLNFICNNNNLYIRLSFHFTYDTDEEIRDFEIYLLVISNDVILMLLFPYIIHALFEIFISVNKKDNLHEKLRARPSKFWKNTMKCRQIYSNFQVFTLCEIQAFLSNFLVRKLSINRLFLQIFG